MLKISKRAAQVQFSPIRKFVPLLQETKKRGLEVFEVHIGQPDLPTPSIMLQKIKSFPDKILSYTPSPGTNQLCQAWEKYFQDNHLNFSAHDLVSTVGGSEAILFAFAAVCQPNEELLVFEPFYTNYNGYAAIAGIKLNPIKTQAENGFHLPAKKIIEKNINRKTRGIIICNPNNPTGTVYSLKELKTIISLAKKYNLFVLADETYREFVYQGKHFSLANFKEINQQVILLDSVSKKFSACGARIGVLASKNKKIIEAVTKFAQARLSLPSVEQWAAIPVLENSKKYIKPAYQEYKKRMDAVFIEAKKIKEAVVIQPNGAFYLMIKLPWLKNADHFARWLLTDFSHQGKTVMIAPGDGFYASKNSGSNEFRVAFVLAVSKMKEAMQILKIALEKYKKIK